MVEYKRIYALYPSLETEDADGGRSVARTVGGVYEAGTVRGHSAVRATNGDIKVTWSIDRCLPLIRITDRRPGGDIRLQN